MRATVRTVRSHGTMARTLCVRAVFYGVVGWLATGVGGCAATHVGNDWQCPLAQGSVCTRVAAADPAAPPGTLTGAVADTEPVTQQSEPHASRYRTGTGARRPSARPWTGAREPEAQCRENCRPRDERVGADDGLGDGIWALARTGVAGNPAGTSAGKDRSEGESPGHESGAVWLDSARTAEVIGRIWIAPYVDAAGVYHEAGWIRVVLEPAGWRRNP